MTDRDHLVSAIYNALRRELLESRAELEEETGGEGPTWMDGYVAGVGACVDIVRAILTEAD